MSPPLAAVVAPEISELPNEVWAIVLLIGNPSALATVLPIFVGIAATV